MSNLALLPQDVKMIAGNTLQQMENFIKREYEKVPVDTIQLFLYTAFSRNLNPINGHLYILPFKGQNGMSYSIYTSLAGLRLLAQRTGQFGGVSEPEYSIAGKEGWHSVALDGERIIACRVRIKKVIQGIVVETTGIAYWQEFNKSQNLWNSKSRHMIAKCAESDGFRKAFPDETGGLYTREEMQFKSEEDAVYEDITESSTDCQAEFDKWFKPELSKFPILSMFADAETGIESKADMATRKQYYYDQICKLLLDLPTSAETKESHKKYINGGKFDQQKWNYVLSEYVKISSKMQEFAQSIIDTCDSMHTLHQKVSFLKEKYAERPNIFAFRPFANWLYANELGEAVLNSKSE